MLFFGDKGLLEPYHKDAPASCKQVRLAFDKTKLK